MYIFMSLIRQMLVANSELMAVADPAVLLELQLWI